MTLFPRLFAAALLISVFAATQYASAGSATSGTTDGRFLGIEQGDYPHFKIRATRAGPPDSFIILKPDRSVQPFLDNPGRMRGKRVRVYWKEQTIPFAGGPMKTVVKVE